MAAYVLPEDFSTEIPGVEYELQQEAEYAVITITEPFALAFERISMGYKKIFEYLQANGFREKQQEHILSCFEYVYEKDGVDYMNVYVHIDSVRRSDFATDFV